MTDQQRDLTAESFERSYKVREIDATARTVEIAFSSEEPYERWFGEEVLDHSPQSVRLDRLNGGAAVLVNHDTDDHVGVVESARIDSDKRGRAVIRFSRSERGEEIFQDVQDGIRTLVSVGYRIHKYEVTERKGQSDLVRVLDWEPYEV
ncbi:MAG: HK97 family phage prohead protease, partial [Bacteroidales bacterium]|nr:HK97 family phage prohead protease [Bacteroidales bacterium]